MPRYMFVLTDKKLASFSKIASLCKRGAKLRVTQALITDKLTKYFEAQSAVLCAILYGSFATGKNSPQSDVDVGVFCTELLSASEKLRMIEELSLLLAMPIDLTDLRTAHPPLNQEILTKGIYLKLTDLSVKENLVKKMLYEVADFLPLKRKNQITKLKRFVKDE